MRGPHEQVLDDVLFLRLRPHPALAAALLRAVDRERRPLRVATAADREDDLLLRDEVLRGEVARLGDDLGAARAAERLADPRKLGADDRRDALALRENVLQVRDGGEDLPELRDDLLALEAREALEAHVENRLRLCRVEAQLSVVAPRGGGGVEAQGAEELLQRGLRDRDLRA